MAISPPIQSNNVNTALVSEPEPLHMQDGFLRVEAQVRAVREDSLEPINLDVPSVVTTVLAAFDRIIPHRSLLAQMPLFDVKNVDDLRDYALALGHTHVGNRTAFGPVDQAAEMSTQLIEVRDQLVADATALAKRDLLALEVVERFKSGNGYRAIAFDVLGLVQVFESNWDTIGSRTGVTREELKQAYALANELIGATGRKEQTPLVVSDASLLRQQSYTLVLRAYEEVRNALTYIRRRRGDVEDIAPSLWAGRGKRAVGPVAPEQAAPVAPDAPSPAATTNTVPNGFPGSSPFID